MLEESNVRPFPSPRRVPGVTFHLSTVSCPFCLERFSWTRRGLHVLEVHQRPLAEVIEIERRERS